MKKSIIILISGLAATGVFANFAGSDDFNDNSMDTSKWSSNPGSLLLEQNERLEFVHNDSGEVYDQWNWIANAGSYTENWQIKLDVYSALDPSSWGEDEMVCFGIKVENFADVTDRFELWFEIAHEAGFGTFRSLFAEDTTDGVGGTENGFDMGSNNAVTLGISFDAATKNLSAAYDIGSGMTDLAVFNVIGWNMTDSGVFSAHITAESEGQTVASGDIYGDNFQAIPEPATALLMILTGFALWMKKRLA